jgi:lysophospholipase L1-like esterase
LAAIGYLALVLQFALSKHVSLYYLLPIVVLMLILLASIWLPQFYKVRIMLVLFSAGSILFASELVLEIKQYNRAQDNLQLVTAFWEQKDLRSWRQIVKEMRASGLDASDRHGFVNPPGLWGREDLAIVAIGDSFTQGICVRTDRNFVSLIREEYPNTINLGLASSGPFVHFAVLKEYAGSLKPKLVLWFFYEGNDFDDLDGQGPNKFSVLGEYFENPAFTQNLIDKQSEIDSHLAAFLEQLLGEPDKGEMELDRQRRIAEANRAATIRGAFTSLIKFHSLGQRTNNLLNRIRGTGYNVDSNDFSNLRIMLQASNEHVASWNGQLYFVYLPAWSRYREPPNVHLNPLREQVVRLARDLDIPVIDVADEFDAHPDPLSLWPFRQFGHYNEDGYKLVAETVLRKISLPDSRSPGTLDR